MHELELWIEEYLVLPQRTLLHFLHEVEKYQLDPNSEEILLLKSQEGGYQTVITLDGWLRLINHHPSFAGLTLLESTELKDDIPIWMECSIYRNDRVLPITIKEYFNEVKTEHALWKTMPRRLLRHRTIQQCARVAFGINTPEQQFLIDAKKNLENNYTPKNRIFSNTPINRVNWLKE